MTKFDFHDARRKLTRARDHIQDAEKALLSLANPELYRFDTQRDYENQRVRIELVTLHKPNKTFSCIAGDAIGNLRSVLDYVIVAMLKPINGRIDNVGFPFADDINGFNSTVTKGCLSACPQIIQGHFIREVQAYKCGKGEALWVLNKLRNIEKHRFLIATEELAGLTGSWKLGETIVFKDSSITIRAGDSCGFVECPANVKLQFTAKIRPTFEVFLNEDPYARKAPLVGFLNALASNVERLVNALDVLGQ